MKELQMVSFCVIINIKKRKNEDTDMFTEEIMNGLIKLAKLTRLYFPECKPKFFLLDGCIATNYIIMPIDTKGLEQAELILNSEKLMTKAGQVRKSPVIIVDKTAPVPRELSYSQLKESKKTYCNADGIIVTGRLTADDNELIITLDENVAKLDPTFA